MSIKLGQSGTQIPVSPAMQVTFLSCAGKAERDGGMMKLRQRISGGFRSDDGAKDFALIRSVRSTARKQGWDIVQTLNEDPTRLIANLRLV
jgi:hypothetical protein